MGGMRRLVPALLLCVALTAACGGGASESATADVPTSEPTVSGVGSDGVVRMAFAGDVMLGRGVATVAAAEGSSIFEHVRHELASVDLAVANLESPFGEPSDGGEESLRLVAAPASAGLLQRAGFDALNVANNHAGDAGPSSVADTVETLRDSGIVALGTTGGPVVVERNGLRVAMLAFDATRQGPAADVVHWDTALVEAAVTRARSEADLVTVSVHGGVEYLPSPDPALAAKVEQLALWGADVVWAHGAHVAYDVISVDPDGDGRSSLLAYGLGNFLFDQRIPGTERGLMLEVVAGAGGVRAYRVGEIRHDDLRVSSPAWRHPPGTAVWLDAAWWALPAAPEAVAAPGFDRALLSHLGEVTASGRGDVDGDGSDDVVAAFLRPLRPTMINQRFTDVDWADAAGRSAHLGVYTAGSLQARWVAGSVPRVIAALAVCDGAVAVAYRDLDGAGVVASGAWWWRDFGFAIGDDLPGAAVPACQDIDADGHLDPVVLRDPAS